MEEKPNTLLETNERTNERRKALFYLICILIPYQLQCYVRTEYDAVYLFFIYLFKFYFFLCSCCCCWRHSIVLGFVLFCFVHSLIDLKERTNYYALISMAKQKKKEKKIFIIIIIHSPCVVSQYLFGKVSVGWGSSSVPTVLGLFLVEHKCR